MFPTQQIPMFGNFSYSPASVPRSVPGATTNHVSSPDGGSGSASNGGIHHGLQSTSILAAAQSLSMSLQQQTPSLQPAPDPITGGIISTWLDTHLPVSTRARASIPSLYCLDAGSSLKAQSPTFTPWLEMKVVGGILLEKVYKKERRTKRE